jgi:hypothetical protein
MDGILALIEVSGIAAQLPRTPAHGCAGWAIRSQPCVAMDGVAFNREATNRATGTRGRSTWSPSGITTDGITPDREKHT